ncbi:hypothetical protein [Pseudobacteriovorax antillogorgiicola]|uniref:Uncharacterized protein n=1 Tax=Pseudobacteriovorax antillogorgiicola TaxID=1513793 RepID=A0A1Y6B6E6_9BACT|nr:hypothetical protein [Pseudobacteriovorax antillogorgiicola]TCS58800.1 hypothetical protein EDD56_102315 [Pseudobacteriovorax antillogorgiicola]SME94563.1 hypothetical protein SAMN06296036_102128 [Pseudobacteriovorax antillogorgiicola]
MSRDREKPFEFFFSSLLKNSEVSFQDLSKGKEFLGSLAAWAGKGKDEVVQLICREIGFTTANLLQEPLAKMLEGKKIQFTIELVPKDEDVSKKSE